jgi:hypothetical protein
MSDATKGQVGMQAIIAGMDRNMAENQKFIAEPCTRLAEEQKLGAEGHKLRRDHTFAPWQVAVTMLGAGAALFAAGAGSMKLIGAEPHNHVSPYNDNPRCYGVRSKCFCILWKSLAFPATLHIFAWDFSDSPDVSFLPQLRPGQPRFPDKETLRTSNPEI